MGPIQHYLLQHLQLAAAEYGADLLLRVPGADPRVVAAPPNRSRPADGPPEPAARLPAQPRQAPAAAPTAAPSRTAAAPAPPAAAPARPAAAPAAAATAPPIARPMPHLDEPIAAAPELQALRQEVLQCRRCKLCEGRKTVVFGEGNSAPPVLFVGEAPGAVEDRTGRPFVGPAGQLLDRIIENAMGLRREDVFIANVNKCRPPGNRDPEPDEVAACLPYLRRQVELLQPRVLVALGRIAAHNLLSTTEPMRALRGRELRYAGIPVVVTWHPAFLLRDPSRKRETWEDIKRVNRLLGRPEVPPSGPS